MALAAAASGAGAEGYPSRPLRLLVPYAAGGPSDTGARLLSVPLGRVLGTSVVVENRGGAGGLTGTEQVLQAEADGYTVVVGAVGPLVYIPASRTVQYNVKTDLVPLGLIWQSPLVLVVNPKRGIKSLAEFLAYAKANPGKLTVSSAGLGTNTHMASELLKHEAGVDLLHVPYRGTGAALPDLLSGQVDATISDVAVMAPLIRDGKLIPLAVTAPQRSALLPEVPTMGEGGLPGAKTENWYGLLVRAQTPAPVVAKLEAALAEAIATPEFRQGLSAQGAVIREQGPGAFAALIEAETKRWTPIIRNNNIKF
ncbi:MAG: tripartite tricarboxylate transporter substrate binding protein [Hyphomicrobiales bacterium]|nr:tripartite tricarboxylate transporter substrate binding protein [Hyphomicrobiales bacterium]